MRKKKTLSQPKDVLVFSSDEVTYVFVETRFGSRVERSFDYRLLNKEGLTTANIIEDLLKLSAEPFERQLAIVKKCSKKWKLRSLLITQNGQYQEERFDIDGKRISLEDGTISLPVPKDRRYATDLTYNELLSYFLPISIPAPGFEPWLNIDDLKYWLSADFEGCPITKEERKLTLNCKKHDAGRFRYYCFILVDDHNLRRDLFCDLLVNRFTNYNNPDTLKAAFHKEVSLPSNLR